MLLLLQLRTAPAAKRGEAEPGGLADRNREPAGRKALPPGPPHGANLSAQKHKGRDIMDGAASLLCACYRAAKPVSPMWATG